MSTEALPRMRRNLRYVQQVQDGKTAYVVKDPLSLKYFRFGAVETWLMQQMDGTRTLGQVVERLGAELGITSSSAALDAFHRRLKELGLAERTQAERSVLILEALRTQRSSRLKGGNTLFRMRFSLGDPDEFLNRMIERLRFFWTPGFVMFSAAAFLLYALIVALNWGTFASGVGMLYDPASYTAGFIVTLYLTFLVIAVIHEFGHGLTCKNFGGEVHEIGGMLLYFSPAMYCNVNDAWTFDKKAHRLWVTFAGGWIQLLIAAFAAVVWIASEPGTGIHQVAFVAMIIGGGLVLVLNFNPLIPLDGYYALMDWLEIPNLRARSFEYFGAYLKRSVLRLDVPLPPVTEREKRIFLTYGGLATVYLIFLLTAVSLWIGGVLIGRFGAWGWVFILLAVVSFGRGSFQRLSRVLRVWAADRRGHWGGRRLAGAALLSALLLAAVLLLVPWTVRVQGVAVVEADQRAWLRPADAGRVRAVRVVEGDLVAAGDTLLVLHNPELDLAWTHARAAAAALEREASAARSVGQTELARLAELRLATLRTEFAELDRRRAGLTLLAPFAAQVVTPHPDELVGAHAAPGDSLLELWSTGSLRVRVVLAERDAGGVGPGSRIGLKFPVQSGWIWRSRVTQVSPAAREQQIELLAPLAGEAVSPALRAGMVGRAKVVAAETNLAGALGRKLRHTFRMDWLL